MEMNLQKLNPDDLATGEKCFLAEAIASRSAATVAPISAQWSIGRTFCR
jgi:hypothetical protein